MGGTIVTWLQNTEKLVSAELARPEQGEAVDGAVVSKPTAKNTTSRSGCSDGQMRRASSGE